jgi:hypothetical protein
MKYAVGFINKETDATVILEDGGITTVHHNGEHIVSTYYQDRIERYDQDNLDRISEGKTSYKDWQDKQVVDDEVIQDALGWLCPFCDGFSKVSWNEIINLINNAQ